jgi:hypothetical protein
VYNCAGLVPVLHDKYVNAVRPPPSDAAPAYGDACRDTLDGAPAPAPVTAAAAATAAAAIAAAEEECAVWGFRVVRRLCAASAAMCAGLDRAGLLDSLKRHVLALPPFPEAGEAAAPAGGPDGDVTTRMRRRMGREAVRAWRVALCYGIRSRTRPRHAQSNSFPARPLRPPVSRLRLSPIRACPSALPGRPFLPSLTLYPLRRTGNG